MDNYKIITVKASTTYDVVIGRGIIKRAGELVKKTVNSNKIALITDDKVDTIYGETVEASLKNSGFDVVKYVFSNGEQSKNITTYAEILSFLASSGVTRTDAIVALGGGVVGDMAGFAAATYLRGIKYIQIPTTLLAQIDSSVGGKTAIDLKEGKNLVGAFCQPEIVICDVETLKTLNREIYCDGMGEAVKYAVLDAKIYNLLERDGYDIEDLVYLCVDCKRQVVEKDEFEGGLRRILNLGHTMAHGIERLSGYTVSHGRAVTMGLNVIVKASLKHGYIDEDVCKRILSVITDSVGSVESPYALDDVVDASVNDKKRSGDNITLIMVYGIGDVREVVLPITNLKEYLK